MLESVTPMKDSDLVLARHNMIEQQIRPWDVLDDRVLQLLDEMPRDEFVPDAYRRLAYADVGIPLDHGQSMMQPKVEGRLLQALDITAADDVLEVGTGSGWLTALLARLARHVISIEYFADLLERADRKLRARGLQNVTLEQGDAVRGWDRHGPYDAIAVTGSMPVLPEAFKQSLRPGGRLFVVVGDAPAMEAQLITRIGPEEWVTESLFETELTPLINAPQPPRFVF